MNQIQCLQARHVHHWLQPSFENEPRRGDHDRRRTFTTHVTPLLTLVPCREATQGDGRHGWGGDTMNAGGTTSTSRLNGWQVESYWIRNFTTFKMTLHLNKLYPFFLDSHSFTSIARASLLSWMMNGRYEWMSVKRTRLVNVGGACFLSFLSLSLHSLHSWHMKGVERNVRDWHERNVEASVGSDIKNERNWKWEFI